MVEQKCGLTSLSTCSDKFQQFPVTGVQTVQKIVERSTGANVSWLTFLRSCSDIGSASDQLIDSVMAVRWRL